MTALIFAPFCWLLLALTVGGVTSAWWAERTSQSPTTEVTERSAQ
ncbi:hypothetical protein NOK12_16960 [Nocardioides sp. OK12]|nr:hypothetical protein [Nocardioides sp. OK12]GHJ59178.1 hypothetical protein NOK12_16960 [Nocardioides sp. OK12]